MKRANPMSTITVELIITMKTKFTSSNAEKTNGFISPQMSHNFHSQTTDAVVAEWQTACETHGFATLSQTLRSVLTLPAMSKHQPARKRLYKLRTNSEYTSHRTVYNGRNTSSGKALACWFFMYKPQANLVQTSNLWAGPCQQVR